MAEISCAECGRAWTEADERLGLCVRCSACGRQYCHGCWVIHDCEATQYVVDGATLISIMRWEWERIGPGHHDLGIANLMVGYLESLNEAEAAKCLRQPWSAVYAEARAWAEGIELKP